MEVTAESMEALVTESAWALYGMMFEKETDPYFFSTLPLIEVHCVDLEGRDLSNLLVEWLNELIFLYDAKKTVFCPEGVALVALKGEKIRLSVYGKLRSATVLKLAREIKAATYGGLSLAWKPHPTLRVFMDI